MKNASSYLDGVWSQIDTSEDGLVSFEEVGRAVHTHTQTQTRHLLIFLLSVDVFHATYQRGRSAPVPSGFRCVSQFEHSYGESRRKERFFAHSLPKEEMAEFDAMLSRLYQVGEHAASKRVRLMIDAEQTYFQPAIDLLVTGMQRKFNRSFPSVYGTYQCYLRDAEARIESGVLFVCSMVNTLQLTAPPFFWNRSASRARRRLSIRREDCSGRLHGARARAGRRRRARRDICLLTNCVLRPRARDTRRRFGATSRRRMRAFIVRGCGGKRVCHCSRVGQGVVDMLLQDAKMVGAFAACSRQLTPSRASRSTWLCCSRPTTRTR